MATGRVRKAVRETGITLITLGVVVLLFVAYQLFGTNFSESHSQSVLAKQFSALAAADASRAPEEPSGATAATPATPAQSANTGTTIQPGGSASEVLPSVPTGHAIDHLSIPAIGVDKFVVEGTAEADLAEGPGHYKGTALPGQVGNVGIAGHRTTFGAPFFKLGQLKAGDSIYITDLSGHTWLYSVSEAPLVVSPTDVAILARTPFAQLTLTTCNPIFSATSRLVVVARLVGSAVHVTTATAPAISTLASGTATAGTSTKVPSSATSNTAKTPNAPTGKVTGFNSGGGSAKAWFPALSYGLGAILLWLSARILMTTCRRWRRLGVLVAGIAACAIPLWLCFENATRLLPPSV